MLKKFFAALILLTIFSATVNAEDEIEKLQQQQAEYERAAQKAREAAELIEGKIFSVSQVKRQLDDEAAEATALYDERQAALDETLHRIDENETKLAAANAELAARQTVLEKRVRDIYINGQISYLDVLFGATDFADFLTRMDLLRRVMIHDSELVADMLKYRQEIREIGKQLAADKENQTVLAAKAEEAMNAKLEKVAAQQAVIDLMQHDKEIYNQQYDEMIASMNEVAELIRQKEKEWEQQSWQNFGGKMIWPVQGEITSEFGWRTHPIFGSQRYHSGLDIGADYGEPIRAAASGVVIEAGWIGGYGNTVMIDHGGGIVSLYGHNESLNVSVGQSVKQGDVIAQCGSTGNSTGPHCHFEVRLNGEPVSPHDYL